MPKTLTRSIAVISLMVMSFAVCAPPPVSAAEQPGSLLPPGSPAPSQLLISELQTSGLTAGVEEGKNEFVELYNPGMELLDVTGWRIEYLSASHTGSGPPTRTIQVLEGEILPESYVLLGYEGFMPGADAYFGAGSTAASGLLARGGGHVRIVDSTGVTIDLAGWGTGVPIGSWWRAPEIPAGQTIQRLLPGDGGYTNGLSFAAPSPLATPTGGGLQVSSPGPEPGCEGLLITELLPNPEGSDTGNEFIEVYNSLDKPLFMGACSLRLGDAGKRFQLPGETLEAQTYRAFSDHETGIVLPNAIAQALWLISSQDEFGIQYLDGLGEGEAWAYLDGAWKVTMLPTPGTANRFLDQAPVEPSGDPILSEAAACPAGKERNPATNRCRAVTSIAAEAEVSCKPGYARNPATGRCRKALTIATSALPCKAGQQRNPQTNRCRSVLGATVEAKPCPEGQSRSPETNRCRKSATDTGQLATVQDVRTVSEGMDARWGIAGALVAGAIGYALYEWRQDIWQGLTKLRQRLRAKRRPGG